MFDNEHLATLRAIVKTGSFDKAASLLSITPSAVSQRIKLLEERVGALLIVRGNPCVATPAGLRLKRHIDEVALLERLAGADLEKLLGGSEFAELKIATNADSLSTWLPEALAGMRGLVFEVVVDNEASTLDLLRRGDVVAAVSTFPGPVQGCDSTHLGRMRYVASASPAFVETWFPHGLNDASIGRAPCIAFDARDSTHLAWLEKAGFPAVTPPTHLLAGPDAIAQACERGMGWAMNPEILIARQLASGSLTLLSDTIHEEIDLHWHCSRIVSSRLAAMSTSMTAAARKAIR